MASSGVVSPGLATGSDIIVLVQDVNSAAVRQSGVERRWRHHSSPSFVHELPMLTSKMNNSQCNQGTMTWTLLIQEVR